MKNSLRWTVVAIAAVIVAHAGNSAQAQTGGNSVVVIDVAKVFKEHARLKQAMSAMEADVKAFETEIRNRQETIKSMVQERQSYKAGTPEYKDIDTRIAKSQSDLQVEMQLKRKEFMEREAKLFFDTYTEVTDLVARFADANNIRLVLRYNSAEIKADDRQSVLQGVNNNVVFQRNLDITPLIIRQVAPQTATTGNGPAIPPR